MEGYMASVLMFAGNFAPRNWAICAGQTISIAQNTALFSLIGTTYGGNGQTTFNLPDLRGRSPRGTGQGPGLSPVDLGEVSGTPTITLLSSQMPVHTHTVTPSLKASSINPSQDSPVGNVLSASGGDIFASPASANGEMFSAANTLTLGIAGGSQPFSLRKPYLGLNYIICEYGIFPSRS